MSNRKKLDKLFLNTGRIRTVLVFVSMLAIGRIPRSQQHSALDIGELSDFNELPEIGLIHNW